MVKRQMEESAKDTEEKNVQKGRRSSQSDTWKTHGKENFRMEKVNRVTYCRKLSRMPTENRQMGFSTST